MKIQTRVLPRLFLAAAVICSVQACDPPTGKREAPADMILVKGGTFLMGDNDGMPCEAPVHTVEVDSFYIDEHEVTVDDFAKFVEETNYVTDAETFGWSIVFDPVAGEWRRVDGAHWRRPEGFDSLAGVNEPVVQISWNDANAYARWTGKRLPTEAEFEFAARGGLIGKEYAWGDDLKPQGKFLANWWQGSFPKKNSAEDGFLGRAPISSFPPNGYGISDMTGNVWEWCADWFDEDYYSRSPRHHPLGAERGDERVIRGGSFLCAENYCSNYRVAGRSHSTPDSAMNNLGFRCVRDAK